jgi:alginate O-acetyltransferase complex protein AlgI
VLFNSFVFLFAFLPIALTGYFAIARICHRKATAWLLLASLVFYGWLNPAWVPLLLVSIAGNYGIACLLDATRHRQTVRRWVLRFGVTANLFALIYEPIAKPL